MYLVICLYMVIFVVLLIYFKCYKIKVNKMYEQKMIIGLQIVYDFCKNKL